MITVRCKECNTELTSSNKIQICGCPNQMRVEVDKISAENLRHGQSCFNYSQQRIKT